MTPLDKDFYEEILNMKHKKDKTPNPVPDFLSEYGKLLDNTIIHSERLEELKKELVNTYTYQAEPTGFTVPEYKSAKGEGKSMSSYAELLDTNYTLFGNYIRDREKSLKESYILEIVECFKKAFEEVYSNECPKELLALCKQYVGNFVKLLDSHTRM